MAARKKRAADGDGEKKKLPAGQVDGSELKKGDRFYLYGTEVATVTRPGDPADVQYEHAGQKHTGLPPVKVGTGWELAR